jgi:hypothetical protein
LYVGQVYVYRCSACHFAVVIAGFGVYLGLCHTVGSITLATLNSLTELFQLLGLMHCR